MSDPETEWEYRNVLCRVYVLDGIGELGYARIGDQWAKVHEEDHETESARPLVEEAVDDIIEEAVSYTEDDDDDHVQPITPLPLDLDDLDPEPYPSPFDDEFDDGEDGIVDVEDIV